MDLLKLEYNILPVAGLRLGSKYSPKTLLKYKNSKFSFKVLVNLAKAGVVPLSPLREINLLIIIGYITTIINIKDNFVKVYGSICSATRGIGTNHVTILNHINSNKLLKDVYLITRKIK